MKRMHSIVFPFPVSRPSVRRSVKKTHNTIAGRQPSTTTVEQRDDPEHPGVVVRFLAAVDVEQRGAEFSAALLVGGGGDAADRHHRANGGEDPDAHGLHPGGRPVDDARGVPG